MSHFYFSNGWGLNVTQSFANVTHSDSGGETVFLKVSRATTKSAILSHTSSHTRVTEFQPFLTFEKVSDSISPSHGYIQTIKNIQIKYRVMGLVSMTACIWCLAFIVVNPKSSSVTSKRHQRVSDPQMYTYVGLETKHGRKLMQLVCKSQTAASSLAKSSEKTSKRWVFYSAKSCRIWLARFQTPKLQAGILLAKKKRQ